MFDVSYVLTNIALQITTRVSSCDIFGYNKTPYLTAENKNNKEIWRNTLKKLLI